MIEALARRVHGPPSRTETRHLVAIASRDVESRHDLEPADDRFALSMQFGSTLIERKTPSMRKTNR